MRFLRYVLCFLLVSILFAATAKADELEEIKAQIRKLQERVEQLEAERKPESIPPNHKIQTIPLRMLQVRKRQSP
jgi:hypothetical protein